MTRLLKLLISWWKPLFILTSLAVLQALSVYRLVDIPIQSVLTESILFAVCYVLVYVLVRNTIRYGRFNTMHLWLEVLIYVALILLILSFVALLAYGIYRWYLPDFYSIITDFVTLRLFLSLLVVMAIIWNERKHKWDTELHSESLRASVDAGHNPDLESNGTKNELETLAVKLGQKIHLISVADIVYLQADGDYVQIATTSGKFLKEQTMKYFEENLPTKHFVRVHRSYIVHVKYISRIELYEKQNQQLTLTNGHKVKVSQTGYRCLRAKLNI